MEHWNHVSWNHVVPIGPVVTNEVAAWHYVISEQSGYTNTGWSTKRNILPPPCDSNHLYQWMVNRFRRKMMPGSPIRSSSLF
jgi:hypothetical protein